MKVLPVKIGLIFFLFTSVTSFSQSESYLRCLEIQNNDSILLRWVLPTVTGEFNNYIIYHSIQPNSGFTAIATINEPFVNHFVHKNVDPVNQDNYYFLRTNIVSGDSVYSDTLQAIKLRLIPQYFNGIARLNWNRLHAPKLPTSITKYQLFRKYTYSDWVLLFESDSSTLYIDTIQVCPDSINYRIVIDDALGYSSVSNVAGDWLQDRIAPPVPRMDSVSTDFNGNALISWQPSSDAGTAGYILYRSTGIWPPFDTVYGLYHTFYTDSSGYACSRSLSYQIAAFDSCGNTSARGIGPGMENDSLSTIWLNNIIYNPCTKTNSLFWSPYVNMYPVLSGYAIYMSKNKGPFLLLDEVLASETVFTHNNLEVSAQYEYFIRAYNPYITSTSCKQSVTTYYPDTSQYLYLRSAGVDNNQFVSLKIFTDTSVSAIGYKILRAENQEGPYECLDTIPGALPSTLIYEDYQAEYMQKSYYYRAIVLDSCGMQGLSSNLGRTLFLTVNSPDKQTNVLSWNAYEEWDGKIAHYDIYRIDGSSGGPLLLANLEPEVTQYADNITGLSSSEGNFVYFIEAIEGQGIVYDFRDTSRSNYVTARQESQVLVPNAFAPKGLNSIFKPVFRFFEQHKYQLCIYDRWGKILFETNNPETGWDGKYQGNYVSMGAYAWVIRYTDASGQQVEKFGSVLVVF